MKNVAILGASGYTGAELVRLLANHDLFKVKSISAVKKAGEEYRNVFPHLRHLDLPALVNLSEIDFTEIDLVFCCLPHATSQTIINDIPASIRVIDLSADFRLRNVNEYEKWYGNKHMAIELQQQAVYGLTEFYRDKIKAARLVAGTGCNAAAGMYPILPLLKKNIIDENNIIIDLATGVSGAGRFPKVSTMHSEVSEGFSSYSVATHRHLAEFDQEFSLVAGKVVKVSFTPHLLPQNRGILATIYVKGFPKKVYECLKDFYDREYFVQILPFGEAPSTHHVRGSNFCHIGVLKNRNAEETILISTIDNLIKGASGQALQNANVMFGLDETLGLSSAPLFP